MQFDYTAVGHVTIDVLEDGTRRAGGSAFYSALQAARLGARALILTRGVAHELEELLEPYSDELQLRVLPAQRTTTLATLGSGAARTQRMLAWAGPIAENLSLDTTILHLAPVARESPRQWRGRANFVGLTPQGLIREWRGCDGNIEIGQPPRRAASVAARCNALVVSAYERDGCAELIAAASAAGAVVAVTAGAQPNTLIAPDGTTVQLEVPPIEQPVDDLGAGDVFAAAFFIALADSAPMLECARFANAAAAVRMRGSDAGAIGERAAIEERLSDSVPGR